MPIKKIKTLYSKLSTRRKWQFFMVFGLMLIGAVAEVATLGAVVPFLAILSGKTVGGACKIPLIPCDLSLFEASLLFAAIAFIATLLRVTLLYVSNRFTFALGGDIGNEIYRRVLFQPYQYHIAQNTSEIIGGINKVNVLVQHVINPFVQGFVSLIMVLAILVALLQVDAVTAGVAMLTFSCLYVAASILSRRTLRANSSIISHRESLRIQAIQEGLGGIRDVIIDNTQRVYSNRFSQLNSQQRRAQATNSFIKTVPRYVIEGIGMMLMIVLAWWVSREGGLAEAVPVLGVLALGAQKLLPQLQQVYAAWASVSGNQAVIDDVLELLDQEIPSYNALPIPKQNKAPQLRDNVLIALHDVSFAYSPDGPDIMKGVNLTIHRGETIGFIGKTGSGKSTLTDLVMGLLEPTHGSIEIEGIPLSGHNRRGWQTRIAHVPQTIFLSDASIAENIALGCDPALIDMERIEQSVKKAQLSHFIEGLADGYNTKVGERGVRLSGGQRQRIGLARALYKNVDVLVLDEATSALDDTTELAIMDTIANLDDEMTVLMIAHRVSTLSKCDRIIEVEAGIIKRECNFQELMQGKSNDH
ncbi:ABC transporter ATP-binding protein [Methylovorus glucosotrophus]|uniref:Cyclolysin secretion/processing ATP-binding protein CyaB n=1 Tax=Methylovorus glucosotrophus (strain SIP3-4) TaxID=582744 RepID=C6X8B3_METGS|nr:ABC transporter ATP-binding protein [Methylovorus glucosotrophus]ACT49383.1 ABC transporter related [Methylovorus glucosotrophus SIP3-4]